MGLALDGPKDEDIIYSQDDIMVLGDYQVQTQLKQYGGLIIDHLSSPLHGTGFAINFGSPPASSCC